MTKKVTVIGGGIVGCITSFFLIEKGYEVWALSLQPLIEKILSK